MDLTRFRKINGIKTPVKTYLRQLTDEEIYIVLNDTIKIYDKFFTTRPKIEVIEGMYEKAMCNPKFRQFHDHQRIP